MKGNFSVPLVSRGSYKLMCGLKYFSIDPSNLVALDVGCSTGGFSNILLIKGAARIYAVDVHYGQLSPQLRSSVRVIVLERTNARYLSVAEIPEPVNLVVCDVSFISLKIILPVLLPLTRNNAELIALIKPQFEVSRNRNRKSGIIIDSLEHTQTCAEIAFWINNQPGWKASGIIESPILGVDGNREFILGAVRYS